MKGVSLNDNILYTVKEVAALLKTNVDYVHKLRKSWLAPILKTWAVQSQKRSSRRFFKPL